MHANRKSRRRNAGVRPYRLIIYCADYKCAHSTVVDASR